MPDRDETPSPPRIRGVGGRCPTIGRSPRAIFFTELTYPGETDGINHSRKIDSSSRAWRRGPRSRLVAALPRHWYQGA
jgi:hypothetical protein